MGFTIKYQNPVLLPIVMPSTISPVQFRAVQFSSVQFSILSPRTIYIDDEY